MNKEWVTVAEGDVEDLTVGTSFRGTVTVSPDALAQTFGEPTFREEDVYGSWTLEWVVQFADGTVATVYDAGAAVPGDVALEWRVGGRAGDDALGLVAQALGVAATPRL